jgi:hypothetical protein
MSVTRHLPVLGLMIALAALDFVGALLAKQYAQRHRPVALLLGCGVFVVLFVVYAIALHLAELSVVTMGWIVLLQVGLVAVDVRSNGLRLSPAQWAAAGLVIALQGYLLVSTSTPAQQATAETVTVVTLPSPAPPADAYPASVQTAAQTSTPDWTPGRSPVTR